MGQQNNILFASSGAFRASSARQSKASRAQWTVLAQQLAAVCQHSAGWPQECAQPLQLWLTKHGQAGQAACLTMAEPKIIQQCATRLFNEPSDQSQTAAAVQSGLRVVSRWMHKNFPVLVEIT